MKKLLSVILASIIALSLSLPVFAADSVCVKAGDVNDSGSVDVSDARIILRAAIGLDEVTDMIITRGDIDKDGNINVTDARSVLRIAIELDSRPVHAVPSATAEDEYAALNSQSYVMSGTMTEAGGAATPMFVAKKGDNIYMQSSMDGLEVGILIKDGKVYMLTPDRDYSLEFSKSIRDTFGMSEDDFADISSVTEMVESYPDFSTAESVEYTGEKCPVCGETIPAQAVYTFKAEDGSYSEVCFKGSELISIVSYTASGKFIASTNFDYVTTNVPDSYFELPKNLLHRYNNPAEMLLFMAKLMKE